MIATLKVIAATAHRPAMTESYKEDVRNAMQARDGRMLTIVTSPHPSERGIPENRERTAIKRDISANTSLFSIDRPDFLVPAYWAKAVNAIKENYKKWNLDALVCIGGNGTNTTASYLAKEGLNVIGLPKTIDNDLVETDMTFGFHTAVSVATEAIDRLHTTAHSHSRIMIIEVMGHKAGWLGLYAGIAGGGDVILIPEIPYDIEKVVAKLNADPELKVEIRGYCDFPGSNDYNLKLSQRRVEAVKAALVKAGIEESRITTTPQGKLPNPPKAEQKNRRCDFFFSK